MAVSINRSPSITGSPATPVAMTNRAVIATQIPLVPNTRHRPTNQPTSTAAPIDSVGPGTSAIAAAASSTPDRTIAICTNACRTDRNTVVSTRNTATYGAR